MLAWQKLLGKASQQGHAEATAALNEARRKGLLRPDFPPVVQAPPQRGSGVSFGTGVHEASACQNAKDKAKCFHNAAKYPEAAKWAKLDAVKGNANAQFNLGLYYKDGKGVRQNATTAAVWFSKAAAQGLIPAQFNLAVAFLKGDGVPLNRTHALGILRYTASQGDERSKEILAKVNAKQTLH